MLPTRGPTAATRDLEKIECDGYFFEIFIVMLLALAIIGWVADRRAAAQKPNVTPGLSLLPSDIKYESPNGNVRVYFSIVTSIVVSIVLTLILRLLS